MIPFLKNYGVLVLAALLGIMLIAAWFLFPEIQNAACKFAIAAVVIIGLASALNVYRSIGRD